LAVWSIPSANTQAVGSGADLAEDAFEPFSFVGVHLLWAP
jgi:hypothetical protein